MLDQHLKQRLVGAVVLIGLGVVVIPFLLRGPAAFSPDEGARGSEHPIFSGTTPEPFALSSSTKQNLAPSPVGTGLTLSAPTKASEVNSRPAKASVKERGWLVQIGSFTQQDNARRMRDEAGSLGYRAFIAPVKKGLKTIYRVQVGPEREVERAKGLKQELEQRLHVKTFLVSPSEG